MAQQSGGDVMRQYLFSEVIEIVPGLDEPRLRHLIRAEIIHPVDDGMLREADVARLRLCCDLEEVFDLRDDALALVMDLVDEMHGLRGDLRAVMAALEGEADDTRARLREKIARQRVS